MEELQCKNCGNMTSVNSSSRCEYCNYPLIIEKKAPMIFRDDTGGKETEVVQQPASDRTQVMDDDFSFAAGYGGGGGIGGQETMQIDYVQHQNNNPNKRNVNVIGGWLILHAQGQPTVTYDLFLGDNIIGRQSANKDVDIPIENGDKFISRKHAIIRVTKDYNNNIKAVIADDGSINKGTPSVNGVYINGNPRRLDDSDQHVLKNGDSVQIGKTTFIFKGVYENVNTNQAVTEVLQTQYTSVINF